MPAVQSFEISLVVKEKARRFDKFEWRGILQLVVSGEVLPVTATPIHASYLTNVEMRDTIRSVVMSDESGLTARR